MKNCSSSSSAMSLGCIFDTFVVVHYISLSLFLLLVDSLSLTLSHQLNSLLLLLPPSNEKKKKSGLGGPHLRECWATSWRRLHKTLLLTLICCFLFRSLRISFGRKRAIEFSHFQTCFILWKVFWSLWTGLRHFVTFSLNFILDIFVIYIVSHGD